MKKLLILENEIYLAQSIVAHFREVGYECIVSQQIPVDNNKYDVMLISSSFYDEQCENFIRNNADAIIIMMISYINESTVNNPIMAGAKDYILKPFIIDELIRKINHYQEFQQNIDTLEFYNAYFDFVQNELNTPTPIEYDPPFIIKSTSQRSADIYAVKYARKKRILLEFVTLKEVPFNHVFKTMPQKNKIYYITNLEELRKQDKRDFLENAVKYKMIISFISLDKINFPKIIDICDIPNKQELGGEIMSIKDYTKTIISKFEHRYPDIELAKKLGMSRKSLWEKRKKYGIPRKK